MKINSEAVRAGMTGRAPRTRRIWRWEKCIPLLMIMTALAVIGTAIPWLWLLMGLM